MNELAFGHREYPARCDFIPEALASYWTQLASIDVLVREYADEFDGEDPRKPKWRDKLDDAIAQIVATKSTH